MSRLVPLKAALIVLPSPTPSLATLILVVRESFNCFLSSLIMTNSFFKAIDCEMSLWSDWTTCTLLCGNGTQSRSRQITVDPNPTGIPCEALTEDQSCNTGSCGTMAMAFHFLGLFMN